MTFTVVPRTPQNAPPSDDAAPPLDVRKITMPTNATTSSPDPRSATSDSSEPQADGAQGETKPLSPQLAALAKQKRLLQVKERELAEREKALSSTPAKNADWINPADLKSKPLSVLLSHGVTYEQLTEAILSDQHNTNPDIQAMRDEIKSLKEEMTNTFTTRDTQAEQQVLAEMKREAEVLAQTGDDFELVRETGSIPDVMRLIEQTYRSTGEVLDVREALALVEKELVEESLKIARIKKVQSQLQPPVVTQGKPNQMRTLTNKDGASPPIDRKARALAAFIGNKR